MFRNIFPYQKKFDGRSLQLHVNKSAATKLIQKTLNMLWAKYIRRTFCRKYAQELEKRMLSTNRLEKLFLKNKNKEQQWENDHLPNM